MYEDSSLLALMQSKASDGELEIRHVVLDENTRQNVVSLFAWADRDLTHCEDGSEKSAQPFHADYTAQPETDECIEISPFEIPGAITKAVSRSFSLENYIPDRESLPLIRALFVGEPVGSSYRIAFQRFRAAQYLKATNIHIGYSSKTLRAEDSGLWSKLNNRVGLTIAPAVDVIFCEGALRFVSSFYAKQVLDLTDYYMEASKPDLEDFVSLGSLEVEDADYLVNSSNSWERRKIASIRNARIIEEHSVAEMRGFASQLDYTLPEKNGKLVIPADRKERRRLLAFLDEDVYRGMFTESVYETNSKRSV